MGAIMIAGQPAEVGVFSVSPVTIRITVRPLANGIAAPISVTGALAQEEFGSPIVNTRATGDLSRVKVGDLFVRFTETPPTLHFETARGELVQRLTLDSAAPGMTFRLPGGPLLGLGEGGPQFDRKGSVDQMRNGQGGYRLATHGTRAPVQWLIGTDGWAMFVHQPYGAFDFMGSEGRFTPTFLPPPGASLVNSPNPVAATDAQPLDVFVVASRDPALIMREYARITGLPEMPARWTFGYQQSHRTLAGPEEILGVARTMREKKLPCDTLIYLGTEFTPSGWNTRNGEITWHPTNFPDPKRMIDQLHELRFRVVLHIVIEGRRLLGRVSDPCTAPPLPPGRTPDDRWPPDRQVSCYWPSHRPLFDLGIDGWWPDQGDGYDGPSRLNRHRMYWEGGQQFAPEERPYALHRNASAGAQRFGGFIWSGDVQSRWATLEAHVPVGINTSLSGLPLWGTDIGGFYGTPDFTGELFVRWFQFAAFCPLFRSHGRNWHLHTPWGWDGGDGGPQETANFRPDPAELHNKDVEPICRKYLELRYKLMPYLYTAVEEAHRTGMPIMRALWLHHPNDAMAAQRGDEYLWGRDILVAPVVARGATTRSVYLPRGTTWIDFWTNERHTGGTIEKAVDLGTMPLFVRAGAVIPMGPVLQYTAEPTDEPVTLLIYPGADGVTSIYEDDGHSFDYRRGAFSRILIEWKEATRTLTLRMAPDAKMTSARGRTFNVRVAGSAPTSPLLFRGTPVSIRV